MSRPNYSCSYQHYYMNSAKASNRGKTYFFKNPTQGTTNLTQYSINEIQCDYSFYNVRAPYNRVGYYQALGSIMTGYAPIYKTLVIPEGNYSITELYQTFQAILNEISEDTTWVVSTFELMPNTNKCRIVWKQNGDVRTSVDSFPCIRLAYGIDGGVPTLAKNDPQLNINGVDTESDPYYSILLWMLGRQVPTLKHKDIIGKEELVATYDALTNETSLTYVSPTIPQASFDTSLYLVSEYFNNFDQTIYEDVTDPSGETDLDITGANISDIWIKIPTSFYNFGDRIWYWPRVPFTFNMTNSNQDVDIRIVDMFNRPVEMNNGMFNLHLVFYFSREVNFI